MHIIRNVANNEKWLLVVNKISLHVKKKKEWKIFFFHISIFVPQPFGPNQIFSTDI